MITNSNGTKKLEGSDNWRDFFSSCYNDTVDAFNATIEKTQKGLGIRLGNTNTTGGTLAVGKYIYVQGNTNGVPEGLRKVTTAIANNGSITTSNTSDASAEGGLNALSEQISNYGDYDVFFELVQNNTSHTVPNVNQYRYILVCMLWYFETGANLLVSHTLPLGVFKALATNGNGIQMETHDASRHFAHLFLDSDTSMSIDTGSGITTNFRFSVYGIK